MFKSPFRRCVVLPDRFLRTCWVALTELASLACLGGRAATPAHPAQNRARKTEPCFLGTNGPIQHCTPARLHTPTQPSQKAGFQTGPCFWARVGVPSTARLHTHAHPAQTKGPKAGLCFPGTIWGPINVAPPPTSTPDQWARAGVCPKAVLRSP